MRHRPNAPLSERDWELLSAYIDGEVTPSERQHVERKLREVPDYRQAYWRILRLQDSLTELPIPSTCYDRPSVAADEMADSVLRQLDRSPLTGTVSPIWVRRCATAAAGIALLISAGGMWLRIDRASQPQLMISLEEPPLDIPSTIAAPELTTSTHKAESYLLSPGTIDNAYSILLTDI